MCRIIRDHIDEDLCFVLPEDRARLEHAMRDNPGKPWVMKEDSFHHHLHTGRGVTFISSPDQLPGDETESLNLYMVQPYVEPFLGEGPLRRKVELRFFLAVTSIYPLRLYVFNEPWVVLSAKVYSNTTDVLSDECMRDTHSGTKNCDKYVDAEFAEWIKPYQIMNRAISLSVYASNTGMNSEKLVGEAKKLIASVLRAGHRTLEENPVNQAIHEGGAMCFSHMRVDMGIRNDGQPFIYEVAEFPGLYTPQPIGVLAARQLFHMIGLDAPVVATEDRADYESKHLGGWEPLIV